MSANKWGFPERVGACGLHGVLRVSASPGSLPSSGSTVGLCGFIWGSGRPRWQWTEATGRAMEGWSHNQLTPLSHVSEGGSGDLRQSGDEGSCSHPLMILPQVHRWKSLLMFLTKCSLSIVSTQAGLNSERDQWKEKGDALDLYHRTKRELWIDY